MATRTRWIVAALAMTAAWVRPVSAQQGPGVDRLPVRDCIAGIGIGSKVAAVGLRQFSDAAVTTYLEPVAGIDVATHTASVSMPTRRDEGVNRGSEIADIDVDITRSARVDVHSPKVAGIDTHRVIDAGRTVDTVRVAKVHAYNPRIAAVNPFKDPDAGLNERTQVAGVAVRSIPLAGVDRQRSHDEGIGMRSKVAGIDVDVTHTARVDVHNPKVGGIESYRSRDHAIGLGCHTLRSRR